MKCQNCGGDLAAGVATCGYCGSHVAAGAQGEIEDPFAIIEASPEFATASTDERIARLPSYSPLQKKVAVGSVALFTGVAALMVVAMIGGAVAFGWIGSRVGGGFPVLFAVVPLLMAVVPFAMFAIGLRTARSTRKRLAEFESEAPQVLPVVVVDKRTHVQGTGPSHGMRTKYFATCLTSDRRRQEYALWDGGLFGRMAAGDRGILFVRGGMAVDFDRVE